MDLQQVLVLFATVFVATHAQTEEVSTQKPLKDLKAVYCGKNLAQTLSAVCKGHYNTLHKASDIYGRATWRVEEPLAELEYPFKRKADATAMITNFRRRKRRGVYNECCQKPCTQEELSSYCGRR